MIFEPYSEAHRERCLGVFDANCPEFFAPNERTEYEAFLDRDPDGYLVCIVEDALVGAFGMHDEEGYHLHWILIDPGAQRRGVGSSMMTRILEIGDGRAISIAASHKSAPFFARFGARVVEETQDGWGPGMHRVDMEL
jgi:GNAT superfamily N-acetyltransferase